MEYNPKSPIKQWAEDDRPREKLLMKGKAALTDAELIAILMRSGNNSESAVELARRILSSVSNSLPELSRLNYSDLCTFKGVGEAKALSIIAALELGNRRRMSEVIQRQRITCSKDVFELFSPLLSDSRYEEFWLLFLNRANGIMGYKPVSEGGVTGTVADPKKIFRMALENNAVNIILCHNHPSGNCKPSEQDHAVTRELSQAGKFLQLAVLDHVIIAGNQYFSFADEGHISS
jgi:DNA repair protein RadC